MSWKKCAIDGCYFTSESETNWLEEIIDHHLEAHPSKTDPLQIERECENCGEKFAAQVEATTQGGLYAETHCEKCRQNDPLAGMSLTKINKEDVIEYYREVLDNR